MNKSHDIHERFEQLEQRLRSAQLKITALTMVAAAGVSVGCVSLATAQSPVLEDGIVRARGIVITDARGVERIHIGAPVPDAPNEGRPRVAESTGMLIHDENGRERFGVGLLSNGVLSMGFDAAPGTGSGANRERLHLGVTPDGRGYVRFLDQSSGLAGRLHLDERDRMALDFWSGDQVRRLFTRSQVDVDGWRKLPDHKLPEK